MNNSFLFGQREFEVPATARISKLQSEYRAAALHHKQAGRAAEAVDCLRVMKQLQTVLQAAASGQEVDLTSLPPPPSTDAGYSYKELATYKVNSECSNLHLVSNVADNVLEIYK